MPVRWPAASMGWVASSRGVRAGHNEPTRGGDAHVGSSAARCWPTWRSPAHRGDRDGGVRGCQSLLAPFDGAGDLHSQPGVKCSEPPNGSR